MSTQNTGGPAFPVPMFAVGHAKYEAIQQGLTLRDYFAAKALQSYLANNPKAPYEAAAFVSYQMADAMLKAREQ